MFVLPGYKIRHDVENHDMFSCREHWSGEDGVNMSFSAQNWTGLCMGVLQNGHLPWVFLALNTYRLR